MCDILHENLSQLKEYLPFFSVLNVMQNIFYKQLLYKYEFGSIVPTYLHTAQIDRMDNVIVQRQHLYIYNAPCYVLWILRGL